MYCRNKKGIVHKSGDWKGGGDEVERKGVFANKRGVRGEHKRNKGKTRRLRGGGSKEGRKTKGNLQRRRRLVTEEVTDDGHIIGGPFTVAVGFLDAGAVVGAVAAETGGKGVRDVVGIQVETGVNADVGAVGFLGFIAVPGEPWLRTDAAGTAEARR